MSWKHWEPAAFALKCTDGLRVTLFLAGMLQHKTSASWILLSASWLEYTVSRWKNSSGQATGATLGLASFQLDKYSFIRYSSHSTGTLPMRLLHSRGWCNRYSESAGLEEEEQQGNLIKHTVLKIWQGWNNQQLWWNNPWIHYACWFLFSPRNTWPWVCDTVWMPTLANSFFPQVEGGCVKYLHFSIQTPNTHIV